VKSLDNKSSMMLFNEGKDLFNEGELYEAHLKWEHIWKYGDNDSRKDIKGFIQMSGGLIKNNLGSVKATTYLLKKAMINIENAKGLSKLVNTKSISNQLKLALNSKSQSGDSSKEIIITI
jgi:predicted metal-dependent hydrolase